uniref:Uncharacterized protein n=1 Tax=Solanum lycopersicum TaxID=4081 RepID=A0A3Q7IGU8_SOLLC
MEEFFRDDAKRAIQPLPSKLCVTPDGRPVTSPSWYTIFFVLHLQFLIAHRSDIPMLWKMVNKWNKKDSQTAPWIKMAQLRLVWISLKAIVKLSKHLALLERVKNDYIYIFLVNFITPNDIENNSEVVSAKFQRHCRIHAATNKRHDSTQCSGVNGCIIDPIKQIGKGNNMKKSSRQDKGDLNVLYEHWLHPPSNHGYFERYCLRSSLTEKIKYEFCFGYMQCIYYLGRHSPM